MNSQNRSFNYSVNGFRGVCVGLVFIYHVVNSGLIAKPPYDSSLATVAFFIASACRYGVELFFMISGYVIVKSVQRHASIGAFLWDRVVRIFPVWMPISIGLFVIGLVTGLRSFSTLSGMDLVTVFVANLLLIPPLVSLPQTHDGSWSLTYEWLFYLLAAATAAITQLPGKWPRRAGQCLLAAIAMTLLGLMPRALFFIPGVLLALNWIPQQRMAPILKYPFVAVMVSLLAWRGIGIDEAHPAAYSLASIFTGWPLLLTTISLLSALYAFAAISLDGPRTAWLRQPAMQKLGKISYSFYLWHPVVMFAVKRITYAWVLPHTGSLFAILFFAVMSFVLAYAVSDLSQRILEVRVGKALHRWTKSAAATPVPASVAASGVATAGALQTPQVGGT